MYYVYEERSLLGELIAFAILLAIARWEFESIVTMLPEILAFLATTFIMCTVVIKLARRVGSDGRLDDLRDAGINPFASIGRAVNAITYALPARVGRRIGRPSVEAYEAVLSAGIGSLLAFGLSCYATGSLVNWQHAGRWSPTVPLVAAALGSWVGVYGARVARRWLDRKYPKRPRVELLDYQPLPVMDPCSANPVR